MHPTAGTARRNALLGSLGDGQLAELLPALKEVPLRVGQVLQEPGEPMQDVYFPLQGVISMLVQLGTAEVVEVATIGRESVLGLAVFLGGAGPANRPVCRWPAPLSR
jgi:CRP-like cAMP-binding protein